MIQRIQSLYLALIVVLSGLFCALPILNFKLPNEEVLVYLHAYGIVKEGVLFDSDYKPVLLASIIALVALVAVLMFKNRALQMKLSRTVLLLSLVQIVFMVMQIEQEEGVEIGLSLGAILPVINIVLSFLAYKGIQKDDKLVKSVDRIR